MPTLMALSTWALKTRSGPVIGFRGFGVSGLGCGKGMVGFIGLSGCTWPTWVEEVKPAVMLPGQCLF